MSNSTQQAARLIYKALHTSLNPVNDLEYRRLLALYRAEPLFAEQAQAVATGFDLCILDVSERGIIVVPASADSKFSLRASDIRTGLTPEQKAALILVHVGIAAVFYPTTDSLDDEGYIPRPASIAQFRDAVSTLARELHDADASESDIASDLAVGWAMIKALPMSIPGIQRATPNSLVGLVKLALAHMVQHGLARMDRDSVEETAATYTPTHRLRIQMRELTLKRLFDLAQKQVITALLEGTK